MDNLQSVLHFGGILRKEEISYALSFFRQKSLKSDQHLQAPGQIAREIVFVEKGIARVYTIDTDGMDVTKHFIKENQFFVDLESYYAGTSATEIFQAVTACEIQTIQKASIEKLSVDIPNFYIFLKSITEAALLNKFRNNDFLNFGTAKTKYLAFIQRDPELAGMVPQQYIASYLKITPQSLSRIRKELTGQNEKKDSNKIS